MLEEQLEAYFACFMSCMYILLKAQLTLLLKPGKDPHYTNAYRPISLLSAIGKVIEKVIYDLIITHLDSSPRTLSPLHYGFRRKISTETALSRVIAKIQQLSLQGEFSTAISFDIEVAFDSILYQAIINGCRNFNLPHYLTNIIHSYLHSWTIIYKGMTHNPQKGCPQGSVLGPLLWNIGYNPVLEVLSTLSHTTCFADDTLSIISAPIPILQEKFQAFCSIYTTLLTIIAV